MNVEFDEGPILDRPKHSIVPTTWHKDLRSVASPVLKIAGSRLQIRKLQFLQILYAAQSQPQDSLKGSNQLNLAFDLALDLALNLALSVCCVECPLLISQRLFSCVVHRFILRYLGYSRQRNRR